MNERQRILDLVKKGIISSEEALVLLENLEKNGTDDNLAADSVEEVTDSDENKEEYNHLNDLKLKRTELDEQLNSINHQIQAAKEQITVLDTMEDLEGLTDNKIEERTNLKQRVNDLNQTRDKVVAQKHEITEKIKDLQADLGEDPDYSFEDFSENWKQNAGSTLSEFTKRITDASSQVGSFVKDSVSTLMDNVDWKDINVKVPGLATADFEHQFLYENNHAKLVDIKVANGSVKIEPSENDNIAVEAKVKLFGTMSEETPFDAFLSRSNIDVSEDRFVFQVPNKRVKADLTIYLPKHSYEHVSVKMLNGNLKVNDLNSSDFYAKTANGNLKFNNTALTYLEAENVNGDVIVKGGRVVDSVLATVNGNVVISADMHTGQFTTVNGEVRGTVLNDELHKFVANSVNGNVKLAVPQTLPLRVTAKTRFSQVKNRLSNVNYGESDEGNLKYATLERGNQEDPAIITLATTAGNVLLKDTNND
ncbi:daptomycin-sensing surface protein LiaX [Agrilactobacillus yilanensis]|uniref:Daptomycin-sensing surface protein LiaX n=1 Tax=Agrilactobacillus yilanensis TaxID=2485997 RepID=A0ABW4J8H3_9LACO|nr:daptomycin-sensing surface protein LiaX [Agrilactobacillus yilanensis]